MTGAPLRFPVDALVARLVESPDLPSLGAAVARVAELAEADSSSLSDLANLILSDVQITQKVLRLANSVAFRRAAAPVTTVSKAIARVGSEQIRLIALSALLLERMADREKAQLLAPELHKALDASMLALHLGPRIGADSEESAICAMFRSIGRLMVATVEGACFEEVRRVAAAEGVVEREAARRVTGASFETIGQRILAHWGLPEPLIRTVAPCPPSAQPPAGRVERLQFVSQFAADVAQAMRQPGAGAREHALAAALSGFGAAFRIDAEALRAICATTSEETARVARALDLQPAAAAVEPPGQDEAEAGIELPAAPADAAASQPPSPEGKPAASTALLMAGLQDMTAGLAEGQGVADLLNIALETLYRGLGYRRAVLCLRAPDGRAFRARLTFGAMTRAEVQRFAFPGTPAQDLVWSVLQRNVDVHVRDVDAGSIKAKLPAWHREACPGAVSFVLLPIVLRGKPLGFFYADRAVVDRAGLTAEELGLLRMLKGQTLVALRGAASTG